MTQPNSTALRFRRTGCYWHPGDERQRGSGDFRVIVAGWWIRFIYGTTFKPERLRWRRFHGHRLLAVRLWGEPLDGRLVGVQWQRQSNRRRVDNGGPVSA